MFCSKCGKENNESASFCASCGNQLNSAAAQTSTPAMSQSDFFAQQQMWIQQAEMQKKAVRTSELAALDKAINYFMQKKPLFDEYDMVCDKLSRYMRSSGKKQIISGAVLMGVGGLLFLMFLVTSCTDRNQIDNGLSSVLSLGIAPLMAGIALFIVGISRNVNRNKGIVYCSERSEALAQALYDYYVRYQNCPVGQEYVNPEILQSIRNTIGSGRADSIKEAINILIDDNKKAEMTAYLDSIQRATELANAQLQEINQNTIRAGTYAKAGAFFAAASFFRR